MTAARSPINPVIHDLLVSKIVDLSLRAELERRVVALHGAIATGSRWDTIHDRLVELVEFACGADAAVALRTPEGATP